MAEEPFAPIIESAKKVAALLREADVEFVLAGGMAVWARGGPQTLHDVDVAIRPEDVGRACEALAAAGLRIERPPEEWLLKAWDGDVLIDLIFRPANEDVSDETFDRAEVLEVAGVRMPVMSVSDVLVTRLLAMREHYLPYEGSLLLVRALREQIDWCHVREATADSPYAAGFLTMVDRLGLTASPAASGAPEAGR